MKSMKDALRIAAVVFAVVFSAYAQSASSDKTKTSGSETRSIVQEAKTAALQVKNDFQRGLVLDEIGALQATLRDFDGALATARAAYPHTTATLTALGKELSKDQVSVDAIAPKLKPGEASTIFYTVAVDEAAKGNVAKALTTAKRIPAPEVRSSALREIAQLQDASGDDNGARTSRQEANKLYPAQRSSEVDDMMSVAEGQLSRGDTNGSRNTIESISARDMRAAALLSGAEELNKRGNAATAQVWLNDALKGLPKGKGADFIRYMAIPLQVKLGDIESATKFADSTTGDMRTKAFGAIAVTCAEQKDEKGLTVAVANIKTPRASAGGDADLAGFAAKLQLLNVSAALVDHEQFKPANELLDYVQGNLDDISKLSLEREIQLQRAVILARQNEFTRAKALAIRMQPDSVADTQRGTALRTIGVLETKTHRTAASRSWAAALREPEDRAYALLGIAQALLGLGDIQLPYSAINVH